MGRYAPRDFQSNFYTRCMKSYVRFEGRSPRWDYWLFSLVPVLIYGLMLFVNDAREKSKFVYGSSDGYDILLGVLGIALIVHFLPTISAGVRRLHDTNRSGWMILVSLIPLVGGLVLIVFYAQGGTEGANAYGPDPYGEQGLILGGSAAGLPRGVAQIPTTAPVPTINNRDVVGEIERLAELRRAGTITEIEFDVLKAKAMNASA